jgi:uncharacterized protein
MGARIERAVFGHRALILVLLAIATALLGQQASSLRIDAAIEKRLPLAHPYMRTFLKYRDTFGGADRLLIAVRAKDGNIFTPHFFETLRQVTDAVLFLPGVDRSTVRSLFTPNVRFVEIVEGGFAGGTVIPADFRPTPEGLARVRANILKADLLGRLVADDFSAALISAELIEPAPHSPHRPNDLDVARRLGRSVRAPFVDDRIDIHILGFAKAAGDIAEGAAGVVAFFGVTVLITAVLVYLFVSSIGLTALTLASAMIAVVWTLGLMPLAGFGLDPMSILLPFLIFAIAVSHGLQMIGAYAAQIAAGADRSSAARLAFRKLLPPGSSALATDLLGFLTIALIGIRMLEELAIAAALGVLSIILISLVSLPILLSLVGPRSPVPDARVIQRPWIERTFARFARPRPATVVVLLALVLLTFGTMAARELQIGALRPGIAELRPEARYNRDSAYVASHFRVGVDLLQVMAETVPNGCIDYDIMTAIDRFQWHMANVPGVRATRSLPQVAKIVHAGWNEGSLKWRVLPRDPRNLAQAVAPIETSSGLLNADCSVMPVQIFTADHRAATIARVIDAVKAYAASNDSERWRFRLASGNLAVMAATNQVVAAAQLPILLYVYAAILALTGLTFRSIRAVLCIAPPLGLVSVLIYALMAPLGIGLTVSTLPVAALAVGIGADYGIYLYAHLEGCRRQGLELAQAWRQALRVTGRTVLLTGLTLAIGVGSWVFSALQFQADMGLLLAFAFLANLLGALVLLPALACLTDRIGRRRT